MRENIHSSLIFIKAKAYWKQSKHQQENGPTNCVYLTDYYPAIKKNARYNIIKPWSKRSQTQKRTCSMIPFVWSSRTEKKYPTVTEIRKYLPVGMETDWMGGWENLGDRNVLYVNLGLVTRAYLRSVYSTACKVYIN